MKNIDLKGYLQAATDSEEAWNVANDKLIEFEQKLKELEVVKAQLKMLLDNVSTSSDHLRSLIMDLERQFLCTCGEFEDHQIHESKEPMHREAHAYVNAEEFRRNNK